MAAHLVAICEKQSALTAQLERDFAAQPEVKFRWLPYWGEFVHFVGSQECHFGIVESAQLEPQAAIKLTETATHLQLMAITPPEDFEFECLLREMGLVHVIPADAGIARIAHGVRKALLGEIDSPTNSGRHSLQQKCGREWTR